MTSANQATDFDLPHSLSSNETEALNKHGLFFKKRILHQLREVPGFEILAEELGVSYGPTRVIDIVGFDKVQKPYLFFVFECKKAFTAEKKWFFFEDVDEFYRVLRVQSGLQGQASVFSTGRHAHLQICSEGYEYQKSTQTADQNPVFRAASQLAAGYLGFIARRHRDLHPPTGAPSEVVEKYIPVLLTNAELAVLDYNVKNVALETGTIPENPNFRTLDWLILKHPFPTPEGLTRDLRDEAAVVKGPRCWAQQHKESIYVVRSTALGSFMGHSNRDQLRWAQSLD